jgi:phosphoribosylanthranilate isomerase
MTRVKVCGLSQVQDIEAVNEAMPDYIGFVFAPSRRQVTPQHAETLRKALEPGILTVGVFVNADPMDIAALARQGVIDLAQLHGDEDAETIERVKALAGCPVIRAVRVRTAQDILAAQETACDYLLLDTFHNGQYGGSGATFDWALIPPLHKPFFLAGGIGPHNAAQAISATRPFALDASSALETGGVKNADKIKQFVSYVRGLNT